MKKTILTLSLAFTMLLAKAQIFMKKIILLGSILIASLNTTYAQGDYPDCRHLTAEKFEVKNDSTVIVTISNSCNDCGSTVYWYLDLVRKGPPYDTLNTFHMEDNPPNNGKYSYYLNIIKTLPPLTDLELFGRPAGFEGCYNIPFRSERCAIDSNNIYSFTTNGVKYEVIKQKLDWINAAACAVSRGGMLAEINSKQENDSILYYVKKAGIIADSTKAPDGGNGSYLWIGGNDIKMESKWVWNGNNDSISTQYWQGTSALTGGVPVGGLYNNWGNEPDNYKSKQHALGFAYTNWPRGIAGQWNDIKLPLQQIIFILIIYIMLNSVFVTKKREPYCSRFLLNQLYAI